MIPIIAIQRFSPARAGNISPTPRQVLQSYGSAPLARGIFLQPRSIQGVFRFSPARAGNIIRQCIFKNSKKVQPRSRGEYFCSRALYRGFSGSAPLARGIFELFPWQKWLLRFSPARAGNMNFLSPLTYKSRVQPRSRGEYNNVFETLGTEGGSAPLARGIF